jgi:hypothetical protein
MHELFIQYTLNPFSNLRDKIDSKRFDAGLSKAVERYNADLEATESLSSF